MSTHDARNVPVRVKQFPVMPRFFSLTGHKTQGQTMDSIVIHLPDDPIERARIPGSWLYVQFSCVKKLDDLFLMSPLTQADLRSFKPNTSAINEMKQLTSMEQSTLKLVFKSCFIFALSTNKNEEIMKKSKMKLHQQKKQQQKEKEEENNRRHIPSSLISLRTVVH